MCVGGGELMFGCLYIYCVSCVCCVRCFLLFCFDWLKEIHTDCEVGWPRLIIDSLDGQDPINEMFAFN